jgi:glycosyltransferase involved in cell wall biosynthesis
MAEVKPLRVLFLTRYPVSGASSRYRVHQYVPYLEAEGLQCTVQSFMDEPMYALSFSPGHTVAKLWLTAKAVVRRVRAVLGHRRYDVVYMQRELLPFGPPWLERWLKRRGARLAFDYDDALFIAKPSRYNPLASLFRAPGKVRELFGLVDLVVAGNDWLRDQAIAHGGRAVTLEVAEDAARFPERDAREGADVVIGWLGSTSTAKYLRLIEPVLQDFATRHPHVKFELMGSGVFEMPGVSWRVLPWSMEGEVEALGRWDIGLMPLPEEEWAKGKSGGKARTYMAAGVVPVCTAIGYNLELIAHGTTGMLCRSPEDWTVALSQLIEQPDQRAAMATAARKQVELRFSPVVVARRMAALLEAMAAISPFARQGD